MANLTLTIGGRPLKIQCSDNNVEAVKEIASTISKLIEDEKKENVPFLTSTLIAYLKGTKFEKEVYWGLGISTIGLLIVQGQSINLDTRFLYGNFLSLLSGMCIAVTYIFAAKIRKNTENTTYGRTLFFIASITIALLAFLVGDSLINFKKLDALF